MTENINSLTSTAAQDVIGFFDENLNQVFTGGSPIKVQVNPSFTYFTHPLERGAVSSDHVIRNQTEVTLFVYLSRDNIRTAYNEISAAANSFATLTVQTKTDTYTDLSIVSYPHDEDSADMVVMQISLIENQEFGTDAVFVPQNENSADTVNRGQQEPAADTSSTFALRLADTVSGAF
jgi:hypothetical protein